MKKLYYAHQLRIMPKRKHWSDTELKYILDHANKIDPKEMVAHLKCKPLALYNVARLQLGITIEGLLDKTTNRWTPAQKKLLAENYGKMPDNELALLCNKTPLALRIKASRMKLSK